MSKVLTHQKMFVKQYRGIVEIQEIDVCQDNLLIACKKIVMCTILYLFVSFEYFTKFYPYVSTLR